MVRRSLLTFAMVLLVLYSAWSPGTTTATAGIRLAFISVGLGDATLIEVDGYNLLIDGGDAAAGPVVAAYLQSRGVTHLDTLIVTHGHYDHVDGLIYLLDQTDVVVDAVLYNGYSSAATSYNVAWDTFLEALDRRGLSLSASRYPQVHRWGGLTARVLNPVEGLKNPEDNSAAMALHLEYGSLRITLPSDILASNESEILGRGSAVSAPILEASHHGGEDASSVGFLGAVEPEVVILAVNSVNPRYPHPNALERLYATGARILRTDQAGTIWITSDGTSYSVFAESGAATATSTATGTATATSTATGTATRTATATATATATRTATATPTPTSTRTSTATATRTSTATATATRTSTSTGTATPTNTTTSTATTTSTPTPTSTPTWVFTPTVTRVASPTFTRTPSPTAGPLDYRLYLPLTVFP